MESLIWRTRKPANGILFNVCNVSTNKLSSSSLADFPIEKKTNYKILNYSHAVPQRKVKYYNPGIHNLGTHQDISNDKPSISMIQQILCSQIQ